MRYLVKINQLQEKVIFFEEKLRIVIDKIDYLEKLKGEFIWEGPAKEALIIKYDEYINELRDIAKRILNIILFLKSYCNNYNEEYERLRSKYSNILTSEVIL